MALLLAVTSCAPACLGFCTAPLSAPAECIFKGNMMRDVGSRIVCGGALLGTVDSERQLLEVPMMCTISSVYQGSSAPEPSETGPCVNMTACGVRL